MRRPHKTGVSPSYIAIYNVTTQRLTTIQQSRTPQSQVAGASADSTWVVWEEADYAPNFFDWTLFAYNCQPNGVEHLVQARVARTAIHSWASAKHLSARIASLRVGGRSRSPLSTMGRGHCFAQRTRERFSGIAPLLTQQSDLVTAHDADQCAGRCSSGGTFVRALPRAALI